MPVRQNSGRTARVHDQVEDNLRARFGAYQRQALPFVVESGLCRAGDEAAWLFRQVLCLSLEHDNTSRADFADDGSRFGNRTRRMVELAVFDILDERWVNESQSLTPAQVATMYTEGLDRDTRAKVTPMVLTAAASYCRAPLMKVTSPEGYIQELLAIRDAATHVMNSLAISTPPPELVPVRHPPILGFDPTVDRMADADLDALLRLDAPGHETLDYFHTRRPVR